jgi:predicted exporter
MQRLGFEPEQILETEQSIETRDFDGAEVEDWLAHPASILSRQLWLGRHGDRVSAIVMLRGIGSEPALRKLAESLSSVEYINRVEQISELFSEYRIHSSYLVAFSYAIILVILMSRYGLWPGVLVMSAPLGAAFVVLAYLGYSAQAINLFHVLALFLILGVGVDYAIFFAERNKVDPATTLAVNLSAATTMLSFGLLSLSSTPALYAMGTVVLVGLLVSVSLSPIAAIGLSKWES